MNRGQAILFQYGQDLLISLHAFCVIRGGFFYNYLLLLIDIDEIVKMICTNFIIRSKKSLNIDCIGQNEYNIHNGKLQAKVERRHDRGYKNIT